MNAYAGVSYLISNADNALYLLANRGWGSNIQLNHTIILNKSLDERNKWLLNLSYQQIFSLVLISTTVQIDPNVGIGLTKIYKKWTFNLNIKDIFRSNQQYFTFLVPHLIQLNGREYFDQRSVHLSVSYRFGNQSIRNKRFKNSGNENKYRIN